MLSDKVKKDWDLPADFQIMETRNKEISLVLKELEEVVWRMGGMFEDKDLDAIKQMFSIQRNRDYFDKHYYDNDMESMQHFINSTNSYDSRIKLLEDWIIRKEQEINSRMVTPPPNMRKPDHQLH